MNSNLFKSALTLHAARRTPHAARRTPHAARRTPHAARRTPHAKLIILLMLFVSTVFAQTSQPVPFECLTQESGNSAGPSACEYLGYSQMSIEEIATLPLITVTVDFYFVKSGGLNFQCTNPTALAYAPAYVEQILNTANSVFSNPDQNQFGTSPDLLDTRMRFKLATTDPCNAIYFVDQTPTGLSFVNNNALHIIIEDNPGNCQVGGFVSSLPGALTLLNIHKHVFTQLDPSCGQTVPWTPVEVGGWWGYTMIHEFGHIYGLCHAFSPANTIFDMNPSQECGSPTETTCGSNPCPTDPISCGSNLCFNCYCTWGIGNNFMGYTNPRRGVTRGQWAQIYSSLTVSPETFLAIDYINYACNYVSTMQPLVIPANTIVEWDGFRYLDRPLEISSGATLIIKCKVLVSEELKIVVKRGGRLFVQGGHITSREPGCRWGGIYVLGNANSSGSQPDITVAKDPYQPLNATQAGVVWINGGTLENAVTAIHTKGDDGGQLDYGGLVMVSSSNFINNGRAAEFMRFNYPNKSYFYDTDIYAEGSSPSGTTITRGVSIWACSDIKFTDVRFSGIPGYCIYGINFTAKVNHCSFSCESCLNIASYGFRSDNTAPNVQKETFTEIFNSDFNHLRFDIHSNSTPSMIYKMEIKGNRFNNGASSSPIGVRILGESKFSINNQNEFDDKTVAVSITNTGDLENNVSCNYFSFDKPNNVGTIASGSNKGLEILGNDFASMTNIDIYVPGNSTNIGEINGFQGNTGVAAGNCFDNPVNAIVVQTSTIPFKYFVHNLNTIPIFCEKPTNNLSDGGVNNYELKTSFSPNNDCPGGEVTPPIKPDDLGPARVDAAVKKAILTADPQNEQKRWIYESAKRWQALVLRTLLQDAVKAQDFDTAETYLLGENTNQAKREVVGIRFSKGNIAGAQSLLNTMVNEVPDDQRFKDIMAINFAIEQSPNPLTYQLTESQNATLQAIVKEAPESMMQGYACALLSFCSGYICEVALPEEVKIGERGQTDNDLNQITVYPNPNAGVWTLRCPLQMHQPLTLDIMDTNGRLVSQQQFVNQGTNQVQTPTLPDGVYWMSVRHNGDLLHTVRVVIIR